MATRYFGEPVKRNEDERLLTGQALFVDDVELPGMLHAAFLRSHLAHGRVARVDATPALRRAGVVEVYTAGDLGDYWQPGPLLVPSPPIADITFNQRTQVPLAKDKVRHVGEPIAVVIAHSRCLAARLLFSGRRELRSFDLRQAPHGAFSMLATRYEHIGEVRLDWLFCPDLPVLREDVLRSSHNV
jgi:CO/xanthine dehydrogenase Mo-binding subunit